jgi:excisionase family DNA binding protein
MSDEKRIEELALRESERRVEGNAIGRGGDRRSPNAIDHEPARDTSRSADPPNGSLIRRDAELAPAVAPPVAPGPAREPRHRVAQPDNLNIDEAAELLGVSIKTFNKVLHNQNMPARKIGREWKFSRQALIDWVGSGRSQEFYKESGDDDEDEPHVEIKPQANTPSERPKSRRTAGWQIEMD